MGTERSEPADQPIRLLQVPRHVGIIMDGNGRWARSRGLSRQAGHRAGTDNIKPILEACVEFGIKILTIYAFSTENWRRPEHEVRGLLLIVNQMIRRESQNLHRNGVQLRHLGRTSGLSSGLVDAIRDAVELTKNNDRLILNVAFNYGGRAEIVDAVRQMMADGIDPNEVNEDLLSSYLCCAGQPDPDLIIRTAGEMRLSNFLIWQAAYAEYYSTPTFWPDFSKEDLRAAILAYQRRERRFGLVEG